MRRAVGLSTGFTLVEMLVAISIIGLLAAMLFPVIARAKGVARQTACINQLRQIGLAVLMYREDCGELPPRLSSLHPGYLSDPGVFVCPADSARGHHDPNEYLEGSSHLASGVSYTYLPNWRYAHELGWWHEAPRYGPGKWEDSTPLSLCHWHWAVRWQRDLDAAIWGMNPKGWMILLEAGGGVRRLRAETPVEDYCPPGR